MKITVGNCDLYHGDALEIMPTLPKSDLIVSDVPYKLTSGGPSGLMRGVFDPKNYSNDDGKPHPTEKPAALMKTYILNSSKPGDVVLDPFMGSCSTGVAAIKAGRRFVGIEKSEKFFRMAVRRMEAHYKTEQSDLFAV